MADLALFPPTQLAHLSTCHLHSASSDDMTSCTKPHCDCFKLDLGSDFGSSFAVDFGTFSEASSSALKEEQHGVQKEVTPQTPPVESPYREECEDDILPSLSRSPSLPSVASSPVTPITPASPQSLVREQSPPLKSALVSPCTDAPPPSTTPPPSVSFSLPPASTSTGARRLPQLGSSAVRGGRPKRRMQVGAFGELSWAAEPIRHTQPDARNLNQDSSDYATTSGSSPLGRRRAAPPGISNHQRSQSWNSAIDATRQQLDEDGDQNWLIAYHVQQLSHERERQRQKQQLKLKEQRDRDKVLAPSPLSRDGAGRGHWRLPSITEEVARPPRSTSLTGLPRGNVNRPVRSTSLHALATSSRTMKVVPKIEAESSNDPFAKSPITRGVAATRGSAAASPTSPLAQTPITRAPSPPPAQTTKRPASAEYNHSSSSRLPRRPSLLNINLNFFSRKNSKSKQHHSRSDSQSSRVSDASESNSEGSEDSYGSADTAEEIRTPVSPRSPVAAYTAAKGSYSSFETCLSNLSLETVTPRTSSEGPETPGTRTPRAEPGTPESDVLATPQSAAYERSWLQNPKGDVLSDGRLAFHAF